MARLVGVYRWFAARAGRRAVLLFSLLMLGMNLLLLWMSKGIVGAGDKVSLLDLELGYTVEQVYRWFEAYGAEGRQTYMLMALGVDMLYPVVYTLAFIFYFVTLLETVMPRQVNALYKYTFAPVLVFVADLAENICTAMLLQAYPTQWPNLVAVASIITQAKWIMVLLLLTLLCMGVVGYLIYKDEMKAHRHKYREPHQH